jgi:hypothetical protein
MGGMGEKYRLQASGEVLRRLLVSQVSYTISSGEQRLQVTCFADVIVYQPLALLSSFGDTEREQSVESIFG